MKRDFFSSFFESGLWTGEVSRSLAFLIIGISAIGLAWYTILTAENVKESFTNSAAIRIELRSGYTETDTNNPSPEDSFKK